MKQTIFGVLEGRCDGGALPCGNNNCVTMSSVCNGVDDCGDFTDELSCTPRESRAWHARTLNL